MLTSFYNTIEKILQDLFDWGDLGGWQMGPNIYISHLGTVSIANDSKVVKLWNAVWWSFMTGRIITLPWPNYILGQDVMITVWVPWLRENVGSRHIDWEWRVSFDHGIEIRFRKGKEYLATQALLTLESP